VEAPAPAAMLWVSVCHAFVSLAVTSRAAARTGNAHPQNKGISATTRVHMKYPKGLRNYVTKIRKLHGNQSDTASVAPKIEPHCPFDRKTGKAETAMPGCRWYRNETRRHCLSLIV
jgi:hypothetical protein